MQPTRAAWFFAAGIAWLVLRGILVHALPALHTDQIAQHGGPLLLIPLISVRRHPDGAAFLLLVSLPPPV